MRWSKRSGFGLFLTLVAVVLFGIYVLDPLHVWAFAAIGLVFALAGVGWLVAGRQRPT